MQKELLHTQNTIACIWDFDKTLIPEYMQVPLFKRYNIDEKLFWEEVNALPEIYAKRGHHVSKETIYLNHLISFIKNGPLKGLTNSILRDVGKDIEFYPGLPDFFKTLKDLVTDNPLFRKNGIQLEHYIISTGLAEMIRGSKIAEHVDGVFACEFIENPLPPYFSRQSELSIPIDLEINQIGTIVDNTIKTRFIFEINKGSNKNPSIDVNAKMQKEDRRVPIENMIYIADGPSDIPVFSVVNKGGGKTFAVYNPKEPKEFEQTDNLLQTERIDNYGPADYQDTSSTSMWLKMHIQQMCDRIVNRREQALKDRIKGPPQHLHKEDIQNSVNPKRSGEQKTLDI